MSVIEIIIKYHEGLLGGLLVTLKLCAIIWTLGIIAGISFGYLGFRHKLWIGNTLRSFSFLLSGVPVLVLLFWLHYPLQEILQINIDPFITAAAALSIINILAVSDIVRDALVEFPNEYIIAGQVCGLKKRQIYMQIQFPIILRKIIPSLLTTQVSMLQLTLFASLISVEEIFKVAQRINASIYRPIEIYSALALFFLLICLPLNGLAIWLKHNYTRNLSEK